MRSLLASVEGRLLFPNSHSACGRCSNHALNLSCSAGSRSQLKSPGVGPLEAQLCIAARETESENVSVRCVRASRQTMNGTHQHQPRDELDREPLARRLRRYAHRVVEHRVEDALPFPFRVVRARTRSAADQRPYGGQKRTVRRGRDWRAELRGRRGAPHAGAA